MSNAALILVVASAITHVAWNAFGKKQQPSAAFFVGALVAGLLFLSPCLVMYADRMPLIPSDVWIMLVATGLFQAFYFGMLAAAYRHGDMSLAYPMARALPVIFVTVVSLAIGPGPDLKTGFIIGVALIVTGCFLLPMRNLGQLRLASYMNGCCLCAIMAAAGTAGYSLTDDVALRQLRSLHTEMSGVEWALLYAPLQVFFTLMWLSVWVLTRPHERACLASVMKTARTKAALTGVGIYAAYTMVLVSMAFVQNVSYLVACRQLSIPLGATFGILVLKEPQYFLKNVGVAAVFSGVLLVALG
ncbi:MAG TPA: multidrug DMT transporter permease [Planctomycetota bacterium]|nr:multidrug DMT transporter permease [Planctomycetota bacterium]